MKISIFNPFVRIAGLKALLIGILAIALTSIVAYFSHMHFPDLLSVKLFPNPNYLLVITESLSNWLVPSLIFYLAILLFSKSRVRLIDVLGTMAMTRIPYLVAAFTGFFSAQEKFANYLMWNFAKMGNPVSITNSEIATAIILLLVIMLTSVWMIALMYNAFKTISNLKTGKAVAFFIPSLIVSIAITMILYFFLFKII